MTTADDREAAPTTGRAARTTFGADAQVRFDLGFPSPSVWPGRSRHRSETRLCRRTADGTTRGRPHRISH
jgi:hypothetical protein